jgi:magnesium transporter
MPETKETPIEGTRTEHICYDTNVHEVIREVLARLPRHAGAQEHRDRQVEELRHSLSRMHPADIACLLEAMPPEDRLLIWGLVDPEDEGDVLVEASDAMRESLLDAMQPGEIVAATENLDADEIADLLPDLPSDVVADVFRSLDPEEREQLRAVMSCAEDEVGSLMDFDMVTVREDVTLETVLRYLRRFEQLPDQTDQLFVVDRQEHLHGVLPFNRLLISDPDMEVRAVMAADRLVLRPNDKATAAAQAFERYDLVSAPVVDTENRLVGRVTVDAVLDFIRDKSEADLLRQGGLSQDEDIFAPVPAALKNRWKWLAINLCTAFVASRVVHGFRESIMQIVALASLMPIVAAIGGNAGNQTVTMVVRAIALGQVTTASYGRLVRKELSVAMVNGLVWGGLLGAVAGILYQDVNLGIVMMAAMTLNLMLAGFMGVTIPIGMLRMGRDPAFGSSMSITAWTDSGGFFIFLALATIFLLR